MVFQINFPVDMAREMFRNSYMKPARVFTESENRGINIMCKVGGHFPVNKLRCFPRPILSSQENICIHFETKIEKGEINMYYIKYVKYI